MRRERFIRKSLGSKAHPVVKVEELPDRGLVALDDRLLHATCGAAAPARRPRTWRPPGVPNAAGGTRPVGTRSSRWPTPRTGFAARRAASGQ